MKHGRSCDIEIMTLSSGGHTGGASGAVHQGPRPLGAHQRGPDSNLKKNKLTLSTQQNPVPMTSFIKAQRHLLLRTLMTSLHSFTTQLLSFRALFKDDIKQIPTVMELAHFLVVKN